MVCLFIVIAIQSILTLETNLLILNTPLASKTASNTSIMFTFDLPTLRTNLSNYELYCRSNHSIDSYPATILSATTCSCTFPDVGKNIIYLQVFLKVPQITSTEIVLSTNLIPFYYICKFFSF
jgi:hypothetical protein